MLATAGIALLLVFVFLGVWQVQRLAWKEALIQRVEQRLHAAPVVLAGRDAWLRLTPQDDEYRPLQVQGRWRQDKTVLTQAVTELGAGYWVLTPLQLDDGSLVLVNRGFVPAGQREQWLQGKAAGAAQGGPVQVVQGLLRVSEPDGGFLRHNEPAQQRWYSRDVAAIAQAQGLDRVAPFFIDAGLPDRRAPSVPEPQSTGPWPRPGMTVVQFPNSHLSYALTWFGLAALVLVAALIVARHERHLRARQG
ncbi:MAG TPA: SURF1 family protein [Macromonas sp.]|nr:SURF1 family protein [Macromonas sp.]